MEKTIERQPKRFRKTAVRRSRQVAQPGQETGTVAGVKRATEVFLRHGEDIRAMIELHARNSEEADDLFQDFFLSLVSARFPRDIDCMRRYLCRAIVNDVTSQVRVQQRYHKRLKVYAELRRGRRRQDDPAKVVEQAEPREARAVTCRFCLECDTAETAERLGVEQRSVSHYVCAGLRKIKKIEFLGGTGK